MRTPLLATTVAALGIAASAAIARDANACGGCFHGPTENGDPITAHRMIFSVSLQQTTLYDEIEYSGSPQSFAWVLPIAGPVTIGLSSDILFASLDSATQTSIQSPPPPTCPSCTCAEIDVPGVAGAADAGATFSGGDGVNVLSQQVVGPYDTVQLQSTDPNALTTWLTANGYSIPSDVAPIIATYVQDGFDFLALKLQPGQGIQAMRPVRVTSPGAGMTLPLRMVAAGTGAQVGITLWVIGQGRYEPTNFPTFTIDPSQLVWDWSAETSNYTTLQQQQEVAANYGTWQVESSQQLYVENIASAVLADAAADDYLAIPASDGGADTGAAQTAEDVRAADLATAFPDSPQAWITRLRADLSRQALGTDLSLGASADQTPLSNIYRVTQGINAPACPPVANPCPPCGTGGSSGSSSGGSGSGGVTTKPAQPGQQSFGCNAVPSDRGGTGLDAILGGVLAVSLVGARLRRRRQR